MPHNQDLLSLEFIGDINKIMDIINVINKNEHGKLSFFSSDSAKFKHLTLNELDTLYKKIASSMLQKGNNAIFYFMNKLSTEILFNEPLETNKQYYVGLLNIEDKGDGTEIDYNLYFGDISSHFRQYCNALFLQSKEQSWNSFIYGVKEKYSNAKNLNDILDKINESDLLELLNLFKESLLASLENIQDSTYFAKNILPLVKNNIQFILDDLSSNIQKAQDEQWGLKIARAVSVVLINMIDFDTKNLLKSGAKKFVVIVDSTLTAINEICYINESNQKVINYAIFSALIQLLISKMAQIVNLCKKQLMNEIFIYDDSFIDFYNYSDEIGILPTQHTFIKGKFSSNFINDLPSILQDKSYANIEYDYSLISINDKEYSLEKHIEKNIQNLRLLFFAEYKDLNSANFIEIMEEKAKLEQNASSFKKKGYLFITEAPSIYNAELNREIIDLIGLTAKGYEKRNHKQQALSGKHQPIIDYSNYTITQDESKFQHIVLQLSPFIKLPNKLTQQYQDYLSSWRVTKWWDRSFQIQKWQQWQYIDSFFQLPNDIDEITEKEKEFVKEFLDLIQDFFSTINKDENKSSVIEYSLPDILSIIVTLCIIKKEFNANQNSRQLFQVYNMQAYNIEGYDVLYILADNAYTIIDNQKIYIFLSQSQNNAKFDSNPQQKILIIDEIIDEILKMEIKEEDEFYANAFNTIANSINALKLDNGQKKELQDLKNQEENILKQLKEKINDRESEIIENAINKISIQAIIKDKLISVVPFMEYFDENPDFLSKIIHYFAECIFDESINNKSFARKFTHILAEEFGILAILKVKAKVKIHTFYKAVISTRIMYMQHIISFTQIKTATKINIHFTINILNKLELKGLLKNTTKTAISSVAQGILVSWIKNKFPNHYEIFKAKYEYVYYKKLRYKYNLPYAVNRAEFVTIPMKIYNAYMCFDLKNMIYGSKLCTGGLKYHSGIAYSYTPTLSNQNLNLTKNYVLQKILGYILLDELRGISGNNRYYIDDIEFFANGFNKANLDILKYKKELYKLTDIDKIKEFRRLDDNKDLKAIDAYNICIDILSDICNDIMNTEVANNQYNSKIATLLECLRIIGQNNIKALYVGINPKEDCDEPRPKLIGRLATTIIIEDGLWIG